MQGVSVCSGRVFLFVDDLVWLKNQVEYVLNIVIVDDQIFVWMMLCYVIEDIVLELSVYDFGDLLIVLVWCEVYLVDLLLFDYCMLEMDGLEFVCCFCCLFKYCDILVILIIVVGDELIWQVVLEVGVIDFLVKLICLCELCVCCYNLLQLCQQIENVK